MIADDLEYDPESPYPRADRVAWDIRRSGRAWTGDEAVWREAIADLKG